VRLYVSLGHARRACLSIRRPRPTLSLSPFIPLSGYNDHFCRFDGTNNLIDMGEIPLWGPQDAVPECWFNCQVKREGEDVQLCPSCFSFFALHPSRFSSVFSRFCLFSTRLFAPPPELARLSRPSSFPPSLLSLVLFFGALYLIPLLTHF
jgi:hypothetical protein